MRSPYVSSCGVRAPHDHFRCHPVRSALDRFRTLPTSYGLKMEHMYTMNMYVYMYVHVRTYVRTYVCMYVCTRTYVCMFVCMYVHVRTYVCMYVCIRTICMYVYVRTVCMYICICTYLLMYAYAHIMYICTRYG